jgi:uncharacterized protein (TIGR00661 family)
MDRVLYAVQSTGNGHINRALSIIPELNKRVNLDILLSGDQGDLDLPFDVKYRLNGLSYYFGKNGGIDYWKSLRNMSLLRFLSDIIKLPLKQYDLVITDLEPVSAWSSKLQGIPCIGISNQATILHPDVPKPHTNDLVALSVLKYYAPADIKFGYNYLSFAENIFTPVIRQEIREMRISDKGHYTVYLPSYSDEKILGFLSLFKDAQWNVFSKRTKTSYTNANISFFPIDKDKFSESLASCSGILCNAGFETSAEALYLGKKLMIIPQKQQYEQLCNVHVLGMLGIPSITALNDMSIDIVSDWLNSGQGFKLDYPDNAGMIADKLLEAGELILNKKHEKSPGHQWAIGS